MPDAGYKDIPVREHTYNVLKRIRQDNSFPTFDMLIREAMRKTWPREAADL